MCQPAVTYFGKHRQTVIQQYCASHTANAKRSPRLGLGQNFLFLIIISECARDMPCPSLAAPLCSLHTLLLHPIFQPVAHFREPFPLVSCHRASSAPTLPAHAHNDRFLKNFCQPMYINEKEVYNHTCECQLTSRTHTRCRPPDSASGSGPDGSKLIEWLNDRSSTWTTWPSKDQTCT